MTDDAERQRASRPPVSHGAPMEGSVSSRLLDAVATGLRAVARVGLRTWLDLDVAGAHHVPATGPVLIASTHVSHADSLALGAAVGRKLSFLGASYLADTAVIGPLLPHLGLLPIDRGAVDADLLGQLAEHVGAGAALVVYPEGSRSRDGAVHRPRSGVARLAAGAGVPVVPAGVTGTARAWPVGAKPRPWPRAGVRVRLGPPMTPPQDTPRDRRAWNEQLHDHLVELSGQPRRDGFSPVGGAA